MIRRSNFHKKQKGFTLLELLTVTAIIGTLASVAIPAYQQYSNRARFSEAILAATPYKNAMELAAFRGLVQFPGQFNSGTNGIPDMTWPWANPGMNQLVGVWGGTIFVLWWFDGTPLSGHSYTLRATNATAPLQWVEGGSCVNMGFC